MNLEWQTIAALAIVLLTLAVFAVRLIRSRKKGKSCGSDCRCGK